MIGNLQCLLSVVRLGDKQIINIDTQFGCIETVECMLCIDEGGDATCLLTLGDSMDGQCGLT